MIVNAFEFLVSTCVSLCVIPKSFHINNELIVKNELKKRQNIIIYDLITTYRKGDLGRKFPLKSITYKD